MKFTRPDLKLLVLCIASLIFLVDGGRKALVDSCDFVPVYTGARCLLHGCNPYDTAQLNQQYFQSGGRAEELVSWPAEMPMYPPSTLLVLTPLALFRYPVVPVERLIVCHRRGTRSIHLPALTPVACHNPYIVHSRHEQNSTRGRSTVKFRHFAIGDRILFPFSRPIPPSGGIATDV